MKAASLLLMLLVLAAGAMAQKNEQENQVAPLGSTACQSTFTSGSGISYMSFCTTQNGNVAKFESPSKFNQLYQGGEGYGVCDMTNGNVGYYDWGAYGDSGWQGATITQPNGPNTFPLTITRTTTDGVFTLKQAFNRNPSFPSAKITMTLKNNSATSRNVLLARLADIDADGNSVDYFDSDRYGAWGYDENGQGLMIRATSKGSGSFGRIVLPGAVDPCNMTLQQIPFLGNGALVYPWVFTAGPQSSTTFIFEYRAM
jgi:hypothetical protein